MSAVKTSGGRRLSTTELELVEYVASVGLCTSTKQELAARTGRDVKTIDKSIKRLRADGILVSSASFKSNGAQLANTYTLGTGALGLTGVS